MEEFDHHIKSKIDSLNKVPGVDFDEDKVWKKIRSKIGPNLSGGLFLLVFLFIAFIGWIVTSFPTTEQQNQTVDDEVVKKNEFKVTIDSDTVGVTKMLLSKNDKIDEAQPKADFKVAPIDASKKRVKKATTTSPHQHYPVFTVKRETLTVEFVDQERENKKEAFFSVGRNTQTAGITYVKEITPRFSYTYGIQFNRRFNHRFAKSEDIFRSFATDQLQIPFGVRYHFITKKRRFNPYLYAGVTNSFLLSDNVEMPAYNLNFESSIVLSYRILSTKDGKEGFVRFRLPLYNTNVINQGLYKPNLYDVLRK